MRTNHFPSISIDMPMEEKKRIEVTQSQVIVEDKEPGTATAASPKTDQATTTTGDSSSSAK